MNCIIPLIIMFGLLLIMHMYHTKSKNLKISIFESKISGRGIVAHNNFQVGDMIEKCPAIIDDKENIKGRLADYFFATSEKGKVAVVVGGHCAIINHSDDPNCSYNVVGDSVVVTAIKPIKIGNELTISYGDGYWKSRPALIKR